MFFFSWRLSTSKRAHNGSRMFFHYRAWNSKRRRIFNKSFDTRTSCGSSSPIVQFYDKEIGSKSALCVYRDLTTNHIHFVVNGKKGMVSFNSGAPDFCYGYVRLSSRGSSSEIQVTLMREIDEGKRSRDQGFSQILGAFEILILNSLRAMLPETIWILLN